MIVLVNGAFGIGKTTVARILVARLPGAVLYDPELAGIALQRLARIVGWRVLDFQDLRLWRWLTVKALRVLRVFRRTVIVPMAYSDAGYLQEIRAGISRFEPQHFHFCLVAPFHVVQERIRKRRPNASDAAWQLTRAAECCAVHHHESFATHVAAADRDANAVAEEIVRIIRPAIEPRCAHTS